MELQGPEYRLIAKELRMAQVPDTDIQRISVMIEGPRPTPRSPMASLSTPRQPRAVATFAMELPHTPPEYLRERVLEFLTELDGNDQHYMRVEQDHVDDEELEQKARAVGFMTLDEAEGILEQSGWSKHDQAPPAHWSLTRERTEAERDPSQHEPVPMTVPGLTTRCGLCGKALRSHGQPLPEAAGPDDDPQLEGTEV